MVSSVLVNIKAVIGHQADRHQNADYLAFDKRHSYCNSKCQQEEAYVSRQDPAVDLEHSIAPAAACEYEDCCACYQHSNRRQHEWCADNRTQAHIVRVARPGA